jgi:hypothetical protein
MSTLRAKAAGHASYSVTRWLHGRSVPALSIWREIDHGAEAAPKTRGDVEAQIRMALAPAVGRMLAAGGSPEHHVTRDDPGVRRALELAGSLGDGDPVDHLEPHFHDVRATLSSPRVAHAVRGLAGALMRAPGGTMDGARAGRVITDAVREKLAPGAYGGPAPPRRIHVTATNG